MYKKHISFLAVLFIGSLHNTAVGAPWQPDAHDDHNSAVVGEHTTVIGNVGSNDLYGTTFTLNGSYAGKYGVITFFGESGDYSYKLYDSTTNASLPSDGVGTDRFQYTYGNELGLTDTADLIIDVNSNPNPDSPTTQNPKPIAKDDFNSTVIGDQSSATGNVGSNDRFGSSFTLDGTRLGQFGLLSSFGVNGDYVYELFDSTINGSLPSGGVGVDNFTYTYANESGLTDTAQLIIDVNIAPVFSFVDDDYDNVDVEFNNRSAQATPLNSARNIKGHLYDSGDKDWYFLRSSGDEIITLEVCPKGTSCFGKKNWVLYVFDSDLLTFEMEEQRVPFRRWVDETGTTRDLTGQQIISGDAGSSNHMYLAYRTDVFEGALIGIVDLCFDTDNKVDIGVGEGARDYLIAISTPLKGDADGSSCDGSILLEEPGSSAAGQRPAPTEDNENATIASSYTTTEQFITAFPYSDDQYAIKITGTGLHPLLSDDAKAGSTTFDPNTGIAEIPNVRINEQAYRATLSLPARSSRSTSSTLQFILSDFKALEFEEAVDAYRATFNPENQQVMIPRVTDTETGKAYSVILQFHAPNGGNEAWLDVVSITEIQ